MSELGRYLAVHYLPHVAGALRGRYLELVVPPSYAEHLADMHAHMWKMALSDDAYDVARVRFSLTRRQVTMDCLVAIDDLVVTRLNELITLYGADRQDALRMEVAMALAALQVTSVMSSAA